MIRSDPAAFPLSRKSPGPYVFSRSALSDGFGRMVSAAFRRFPGCRIVKRPAFSHSGCNGMNGCSPRSQ